MQGRTNMSNSERRGPHKSMHCKFCKPPGAITPEKPTRPQIETKTKIHLAHEAADLRLCDVQDEPGFPAVESEACVCILEGENSCPKCAPDKNREPIKKKVCRCPKGAKPHPSMYETAPKKKKRKDEDQEFWWEKYSREHDARTKETWAAYMAQRKKEKKLELCKKRQQQALIIQETKGSLDWFQKLSCQQMIYVEFLSTAIRLDSDENITDRTNFVLGGLGLFPRPKRKIIKKCLSFCHYNSIQFLNQLYVLIRDIDPFKEKYIPPKSSSKGPRYSWNERLIMNSLCHLEFPALLREIMDRLPPLPRPKALPQIPYPVFQKLPKKKYDSPYEEPIWEDRLNWLQKRIIDKVNRIRAHFDNKRVKIPALALVRRPSLIDSRPPFLSQIEANERASRRVVMQKEKKIGRKHKISTFNSAVDVTAIAGIEASEISTTEKADTDDICVFLREPQKEDEEVEEEEEEEEQEEEEEEGKEKQEESSPPEKEVRFLHEPTVRSGVTIDRLRTVSELGECSETNIEIPFKTPPKTPSGTTIEQPCPPPDTSPGPPATHYDLAKRELDIINENTCGFQPFVSCSKQTIAEECQQEPDEKVTKQLMSAAKKLKKLAGKEDEIYDEKKGQKKKKKKSSKKNKCVKRKKKPKKSARKPKKPSSKSRIPSYAKEETEENEENKDEKEDVEEEEEKVDERKEDEFEGEDNKEWETIGEMDLDLDLDLDFDFGFMRRLHRKKVTKKVSEISDPDPESFEDWSKRPPCTPEKKEPEEKPKKVPKRKCKRKLKCKKRTKSKKKKPKVMVELEEEIGEYFKKREPVVKEEKETMTECYPGEYDYLYKKITSEGKKVDLNGEEDENVFTGDVMPLLMNILKDLADEGFITAAYPDLHKHPDIEQLIMYLKGEIVNQEKKNLLLMRTKIKWSKMSGLAKYPIPPLGLSVSKMQRATWDDKKWVCRLANSKKDEFYFKAASARAEYGRELYNTLYQTYFGTGRYLKIFYAYMVGKYDDCILRGIE